MPDLNDFHAFTSTSSGSHGGSGRSGTCLPWVLGILVFLWILGKLA